MIKLLRGNLMFLCICYTRSTRRAVNNNNILVRNGEIVQLTYSKFKQKYPIDFSEHFIC